MPAPKKIPPARRMIALARKAATARAGDNGYLDKTAYFAATGFTETDIRRRFGCWRKLCIAAGLPVYKATVSEDAVFRAMCKAFLTMPPYCRDRQNVFLQYFDYGIWALQRLGGWLPARARFRDWCLKYQPDFPYLHEQPDMENALMRVRWGLRATRDRRGRRSRSKWKVGPLAAEPASALPEAVPASAPPGAVPSAPSAGPPAARTVTPRDDRSRAPVDGPPASAPPPRGFLVPWIREKDRRPVRRRQADIEFDVFET